MSPASILAQWGEEVRRQSREGALSVLEYEGMSVHGYLQPRFLAKHSIVSPLFLSLVGH